MLQMLKIQNFLPRCHIKMAIDPIMMIIRYEIPCIFFFSYKSRKKPVNCAKYSISATAFGVLCQNKIIATTCVDI